MNLKSTMGAIGAAILLMLACSKSVSAQGCVAIRGISGCGANLGGNVNLNQGEFMAQAGFRYFKSFRHFRGDHEETERVEQGTQVINHSYFLDLQLNYGITNRLFGQVILPFVYHRRSSMYEHGGNPPNGLGERHETSSYGLADVRIGLGYWLFNPEKHVNFNYSLGAGLKLPTGKYDYADLFYNQGVNRDEDRVAVVDQSIQPGDGGVGITLEMQGFHSISDKFIIISNLYYILGFQETKGVLTRNGSSEFSCPDQYAARLGTFYNSPVKGLSFYLGGRIEGVPWQDLIGGSDGYRRPGYAVSVEPGISYATSNISVNLNVPIAVYRNRVQSYQDKVRTEQTGIYRHGDAAFADYLISLGFTYRFGGRSHMMNMDTMPDATIELEN